MRSLRSIPILAGMTFLTVINCHADVIVTLRSGVELHAARTWTDGDTMKVQLRTGVVGLPSDTVVSVTEVSAAERGAMLVAPAPPVRAATETTAPRNDTPAAQTARAKPDPAKSPSGAVEEHIPDVPGEDALAKMARLDALSVKTHRELSIARTQEQPQEVLEAMQRKLDDINEGFALMKRGESIRSVVLY